MEIITFIKNCYNKSIAFADKYISNPVFNNIGKDKPNT